MAALDSLEVPVRVRVPAPQSVRHAWEHVFVLQRTWTDQDLIEAVAAATSMSQVIRGLGLRAAGGNFRSVRGHMDRLGLSVAHFVPQERAFHPQVPLEQVLVERSTYKRAHLKRRLYAAGLKERRCELCGQGEEWHGKPMSLILDHVNGVFDDNRLENLRIVCPNCNATLDTHCGRNQRVRRPPRECGVCRRTFEPRVATQRFCGRECAGRRPRPESRISDRPPLDELRARIDAEGYAWIRAELGVSDNAVRKWFRAAGEEPPRRHGRRSDP
jgi:hypothetical protein